MTDEATVERVALVLTGTGEGELTPDSAKILARAALAEGFWLAPMEPDEDMLFAGTRVTMGNMQLAWNAMRDNYLARATPPSAPPREGWQDIATAPKDGTVVDLWVKGNRYTDASWGEYESYSYKNYPHGKTSKSQGWRQFSFDDGDYLGVGNEPTHWMPLPTPPSAPPVDEKNEGETK